MGLPITWGGTRINHIFFADDSFFFFFFFVKLMCLSGKKSKTSLESTRKLQGKRLIERRHPYFLARIRKKQLVPSSFP
jgi:hypothetical protein